MLALALTPRSSRKAGALRRLFLSGSRRRWTALAAGTPPRRAKPLASRPRSISSSPSTDKGLVTLYTGKVELGTGLAPA